MGIATDRHFDYCRLNKKENSQETRRGPRRENSVELSEPDYSCFGSCFVSSQWGVRQGFFSRTGREAEKKEKRFEKAKAKEKGTVMSKVCTQRY